MKLYVSLFAAALPSAAALSCVSENGDSVDWWVLYKQPGGVNYAYIDSTAASADVFTVASSSDLGAADSAPGRTLGPLYAQGDETIAHVAYNDENPNGQTDSAKAHAKGVLAVNTGGMPCASSCRECLLVQDFDHVFCCCSLQISRDFG